VADNDQKDILISKIRPQLVTMRRYSSAYSKHLISSTFMKYNQVSFTFPDQHPIVERLLERTVNASKALDKPADYPSLAHKQVN
jgi:pumilio RNA-binding family